MWKVCSVLFLLVAGCGGSDDALTSPEMVLPGGSGGGSSGFSGSSGSSGEGGTANSAGQAGTSDDGGAGVSGEGGSGQGGVAGLDAGTDPICTADETRCQGLSIETCNTDGTSWDVTNTCPFLCENGACTGSCLPGSAQCDGLDVQTCDTQGEWSTVVTCPFICATGSCTGSCSPGDKKCEGLVPQTCNAQGQWDSLSPCQHICTLGECVGSCDPDEVICNGFDVQTCNAGGTWNVTQTCPYLCSGGACTGVCNPGTTRCSGNDIEVCTSQGQWTSGITCPAACLNGACVVCTPGTSRCSGNTVQTCNAQGSWATATICPTQCLNGACVTCTPGDRTCDGTGYKECGSTGSWGSTVPCPGEVNAAPICYADGVCGWTCNPGFEDCMGASPGCESDLGDPATCGSCSNVCDGTNGNPTCTSGTCGIVCDSGWANCGLGAGCETQLGTLTNCLGCGDACGPAGPNSSVTCEATGCAVTCAQTWGDCDEDPSNGCEHDVWNDPENCGTCGKNCFGGTCSNGVCSQDLELVAEANGFVTGLLVGGNYVYWSTSGTPGNVYRALKIGGAAELLGSDQDGQAALMAITPSDLIYYDGLNQDIQKMPLGGGSTVVLAAGRRTAQVVSDDTYIYWNDQDNIPCYCSTPNPTHVYRTLISGGSVELVATFTLGTRYYLAVDESRLFLGNDGQYIPSPVNRHYGAPHPISKGNLGATYVSPPPYGTVMYQGVSRQMTGFGRFSLNDTNLFFWARLDNGTGGLVRMEKSGAFSRLFLLAGGGESTFWVPDVSYVYYQTSPYVKRVSVNGGSAQNVATNQWGGQYLDIDDTHVYWHTQKFSQTAPVWNVILRAAK